MPTRTNHRGTGAQPVPQAFIQAVSCAPAYLVWSAAAGRNNLYTPAELAAHVQLDPITTTPGGVVYQLRALPGTDPEC